MADGRIIFSATSWGIETWLPRITVGTHLNDWRIVIPVPEVTPAFDNLALYPARKLIALFDHLIKVGKRSGIQTTLDHVRISIVRHVHPSHQYRSIHHYMRQTDDGVVPTVVTYQRPHSRRTVDYNNGKVTIHPGAAEQEYWKGIAEGYFFNGTQMTVPMFRQALLDGRFPTADDAAARDFVAFGDHFRFG